MAGGGRTCQRRHCHDDRLNAENGSTVMRDVFDYAAPLGPLGWIAERLFLTAYMRRFLEARNDVLKAVAETPDTNTDGRIR